MKPNRRLLVFGGASGIIGAVFYFLAIFLDVGSGLTVLLIFCWTLFSVLFMYSLFLYLDEPKPSLTARTGFILTICGFTTVFIMIVVQLAVRSGTDYYKTTMPGTEDYWKSTPTLLRLTDLGLDIAWDIFIGSSLILFGISMFQRKGFKLGWSVPAILAGVLLILLNLITFPFPPNTRGFFDIGPYILLFLILLSVRLVLLGRIYISKEDAA